MAFVTPGAASARDRFDHDLGLTVERFRGLALARLRAPWEVSGTRADAGHALAQALADASADLRGEPRRAVPRLADAAVGDQLAVCGHELAAAAGEHPGEPADRALVALADALLGLRRRV
jgi:hypothetical protein